MHLRDCGWLSFCLGILGFICLGPQASDGAVLGAAYDYPSFFENFDTTMGTNNVAPSSGTNTMWSVWANGTDRAENLTVVANFSDWGATISGFNAAATTFSNRYLSIFKSSNGNSVHLTARLVNSTGGDLSQIYLRYDMLGGFCGITNSYRTATFAVQYSTNNSPPWVTINGYGATINNSLLTTGYAARWLSDREMDTLGLSMRNLGGTYALPTTLRTGQVFYIRWFTGTAATEKNMNYGIDNLRGPCPYIVNEAATGVTASAATLMGHLLSTGNVTTAVSVYWGPTDGGAITSGLWAVTNSLGAWAEGSHPSVQVDPTLFFSGDFYYRFAATNASGVSAASTSGYFATPGIRIKSLDANASEEGPHSGTVVVSRPLTETNDDLVVNYSLSGTAVNGRDYESLPGAVTLAAGQASATIAVTPIDDKRYEGLRTVVLSILPGPYDIGIPSSATVAIKDNETNATIFSVW